VSLRTKLLLLVTVSIAGSVGAVAWLIEEQAHEAFRLVEQERTTALVNQFRREFDHEGEEITRGVEAIAGSDAMLRTVVDLSKGAEPANYVNEAAPYADVQRLDFLDVVSPDGTIISSSHWPARFGYKQRWFLDRATPLPQQAFLKHVETQQGSQLAMLCFRPLHTHGADYYLIGGRKLGAVVQSLTAPEGLQVSIYSAPEQGSGEFIGPAKENPFSVKIMPWIQKVLDQRSEVSTTIEWGPDLPQEEILHAIPLPGYSDRVPAVLLVGVDVLKAVKLFHFAQQNGTPLRQVPYVVALKGVLVERIASPSSNTQILRRLAYFHRCVGGSLYKILCCSCHSSVVRSHTTKIRRTTLKNW